MFYTRDYSTFAKGFDRANIFEEKEQEKRGTLTRVFDLLQLDNYVMAGAARGLIPNNNISIAEGIVGGLKAGNPFGKGYAEGRHIFSDVLGDSGWNPQSLQGRIAKGVTGFAGDVFLSPSTYLTGGVSTLVRGTGKVGAKLSHNVAGMTLDTAQTLIQGQRAKRGLGALPAPELAVEADKFVKRFGKVIGLNENARDLTWSLRGAPFGEKIFKSFADTKAYQGVTLSRGEVLAQFGDMTLAPLYGKVRNSILGGKIGQLFSTSHPLFKLSKKNPLAVYDDITFMEHIRGLTKDKRIQEELLRDKAKKMNLSPDETTEVLRLMEDSSIWNTVKRSVKFTDTKEAVSYRKNVQDIYKKTQDEFNVLLDERDKILKGVGTSDDALARNTEKLDMLRRQQDEALAVIEPPYTKEYWQIQDRIKEVEARQVANKEAMRVHKTDDFMKKLEGIYGTTPQKTITPDDLLQKYNKYKQDSEVIRKHRETASIIEEKAKKVSKPQDLLDEYVYKMDTTDTINADQMVKSLESEPFANKAEIADALSEYLYDRPGLVSPYTWDTFIDTAMDMVKKGRSKGYIRGYVRNNHIGFAGYGDVYTDVARKIGLYGEGTKFKTWGDYLADQVKDPLKRLNKAQRDDVIKHLNQGNLDAHLQNYDRLSKANVKKLLDLQDVKKQRDVLINERYNTLRSPYAMSAEANQKLYDDLSAGFRAEGDEAMQVQRNIDRFAGTERKPAWMGKPSKMTMEDKGLLREDLIDHLYIKGRGVVPDRETVVNKLLPRVEVDLPAEFVESLSNQRKFINAVFDEVDGFAKKSSRFTVPKRRETVGEVIKSVSRKPEFPNISPRLKQNLFNEMVSDTLTPRQQTYLSRVGAEAQQIIEGTRKDYKHIPDWQKYGYDKRAGQHISGLFDEAAENLARKGRPVKGHPKKMTAEQFRESVLQWQKKHQPTTYLTNEQQELSTQLKKAMQEAKQLDADFDAIIRGIDDDLGRRIRETQNMINTLNESKGNYNKVLRTANDVEIDRVSREIYRLENALADEDAFTTLIKALYGEGAIKQAIRKEPRLSMTVLDADMSISDKVKNIVRTLRDDLKEIGASEVEIRKLDNHQFLANMYDYFPHHMTDAGRKLFRNKDEVFKKFPQFGDQLGYGRKWNPFARSRKIKELGGIKDPNVRQINEFFQKEYGDILKGKNVFSEDVADVFLTRALKNTELMYDDAYMRSMLNTFGDAVYPGMQLQDGYKAVMNYGLLKETVQKRARIMTNAAISKKKSLGVKIQKDEFANLFETNLAKVFDDMGLDSKVLNDWATPMVEVAPEKLTKLSQFLDNIGEPNLIRQVNEAIVLKANQARKLQIMKDESRFLQLYDKFTHFIKLNQTTVLPSFHMRNKMSNVFNSWLEIGSDALDVDFHRQAWRAVRDKGKTEGVMKIVYKDGSVGSISWSELYHKGIEYDAIGEGFFAKDIGAGAMSTGVLKGVKKGFDPTDTKNFIPYQKGAYIGGLVEGQDRLIHFASQVSRGMSFEDAAASSRRFLFDYGDLTAFEASVMKRIFPYYTWLRKNAMLQFESIMDKPGKYQHVAKVLSSVESMVAQEERINKALISDFAKNWVQTPFTAKTPDGRDKQVLWNPNLPFMDLTRLPTTSPKRTWDVMFPQVNPLIKTPIEQIMNKNVFFDSPIVRPGQPQMQRRFDHAASQIAPYNVAKGVMTKRGSDLGLHGLNTLSGVKFLSYDYDRFKAMKMAELERKR